jgi:small-conductance mechanosensitive channel
MDTIFNEIPAWFLVLSLFLPRLSLIAAFYTAGAFPHLFSLWFSIPMALFIPRVLILIAIATVMGLCPWFWVHLVVAVIVWMTMILSSNANKNNS